MKTIVSFIFVTAILVSSYYVQAQHHHTPGMQMDTTAHQMPNDSMAHEQRSEMPPMTMTHSFSLNLPMNRNGSGTSWMPDATPIYAYMKHTPSWMFMLHGSAFLRYNAQDIGKAGSKGGNQFDFPNMVMFMGQRQVGNKGLFRFSTMLSLDPITVGASGYPLLFQSGEMYQGRPLVNRQHPHDLFSELSVAYTQSFNQDMDTYVYVGYPGEPALGPPAFVHRISGFSNPDAPLGHHWQDATHIVFGVTTVGFRYKQFKVEGSSFTGREPDENRYNFDKPRFDSYSYRLSFNPSREFALQFSQGFLKSPEQLEANEDIRRTTASVIHSKELGNQSFLTSSLVWGMNAQDGHEATHSVLLESNWQRNKTALYGRYEFVQKSAGELALDNSFEGKNPFSIQALTLGVNRTLLSAWHTNFTLGVQGTVFMANKQLEPIYGKNPVSAEIYLRLTPTLWTGMSATPMDGMHHH